MRNSFLLAIFIGIAAAACFQSCQSENDISYRQYYVNGKRLYDRYCQSCHGSEGQGLGKLYPPLTDSAYLNKHKQQLACMIRNGMTGMVTVHGISYDGEMPGNPQLPDIDIAQIIVYVTNSFGNDQGFYGTQSVTSDLKNCR